MHRGGSLNVLFVHFSIVTQSHKCSIQINSNTSLIMGLENVPRGICIDSVSAVCTHEYYQVSSYVQTIYLLFEILILKSVHCCTTIRSVHCTFILVKSQARHSNLFARFWLFQEMNKVPFLLLNEFAFKEWKSTNWKWNQQAKSCKLFFIAVNHEINLHKMQQL